jgi:hypothetical protein
LSWIWHFLISHPGPLNYRIGDRQEQNPVTTRIEIARAHARNRGEWLQNGATEFLLSFDKVHVNEWADSQKREIIIFPEA